MPWSGSSGSQTFSRTDGTRSGAQTWQTADAAGVDIIATDHDTHDQDLADGLNSALKKDGGNTATANLPMGGFRHTNVGAASARTDYARFSDLQDGKGTYAPTVGGTANAITLTTGYSVSAYAAGQRFSFIVGTTNTGATTINVDGSGVKALVRADGASTALAAGDLVAGMIADVQYDGTSFQLLSTQAAYGVSGDVLARIVKVGSVLSWPMTTVPGGWLECDGSAVSRTTYAELYAALGTAYGVGDGSTTFNLPNYKDYFLRGFDASGTEASSRTDRGDGTTGASVGTKQGAAMLRHNHTATVTDAGHNHTERIGSAGSGGNNAVAGTTSAVSNTTTINTTSTDVTGITVSIANTSSGDSTAETRPKNVTVKFIILALPAAASAATLGVNGFLYTWDTGTSDADPGSGKLRINNATASSATKLYINETGGNSESLASILATWDDSTSTIKGDLYIYKVGALGTYLYFQVTGSITDAGSYDKFDLTYVGNNGTLSNGDNVAVLFIRNGQKGDPGVTGNTGASGVDAGLRYSFASSTTMANPSSGNIRLNNATLSSVTAIALSNNSADTGNPDVSGVVATWDDSTNSALMGTLFVKKASAPENFVVFSITGANTDNSGWKQLAVTYVASSGSFSASDTLSLAFSRTGNVGTTGSSGTNGTNGTDPGIRWLFATSTTMADPSSGNIRLNNATLSSVTAAAVSANSGESGNPSVLAYLQAWDDSTTTAHRGYVIIKKASAPQNFAVYDITGALTDNTTWVQLALTYVTSSGSFSASDTLAVQFNRTGDAGSGSVSGMSNHGIPVASGAAAIGSSIALTDGQLVVGQTGADPLAKTMSGDATLSAAGALTIASNAISNVKAAQMAANTVKGNNTGSTANASDLTAQQVRALAVDGFTGRGDAAYTILATDRVVGTNAAFTASRTFTLPAANSLNAGQPIVVADFQGTVTGTNTLVIARAGSDTIDGATSYTIDAAYGFVVLVSDGASKWKVVAATKDIHYDTTQNLTTSQQSVALRNIGANQFNLVNGKIVESHASNAATFAVKGLDGNDPSSTNPVLAIMPDGTQVAITAALSQTISSGSTMGVNNAEAFNVWIALINDSGTLRLGVRQCRSGTGVLGFPGNGILSATNEGGAGAADSGGVTYSNATVTSKPFVVVALAQYDSGLTTAGTWAASPSRIHMIGPGSQIAMPGTVLQDISISTSGSTLSASTTYTDVTGSTISITPAHAANFVTVCYSGGTRATAGGSGVNSESQLAVYKGGSLLSNSGSATIGVVSGSGTNFQTDGGFCVEGALFPLSTSAQSFTLRHACLNTNHNVTTSGVMGRAQEVMA